MSDANNLEANDTAIADGQTFHMDANGRLVDPNASNIVDAPKKTSNWDKFTSKVRGATNKAAIVSQLATPATGIVGTQALAPAAAATITATIPATTALSTGSAIGWGTVGTGALSMLLQACKKDPAIGPNSKVDTVYNHIPVVAESGVAAANYSVFYGYIDDPHAATQVDAASILRNNPAGLAAAQNYGRVLMQPGHITAQQAKDAGIKNAVGYMSGISLDPNTPILQPLINFMNTREPDVGDGKIHDGWLRDNAGNKVKSTGGDGNLVDIRKPWVAKKMLEYGLGIGQNYSMGLTVDEADQAIYAEDTHTEFAGLTQAFAQLHNDLAVGVYYNYVADDIYKTTSASDPTQAVRKSLITLVNDASSSSGKVAQRTDPVTNKTSKYTPTYHPTDILSGIQPSTHDLSTIIARYAGESGCTLTLESRFYETAGKKNPSSYTDIVKGQLVKVAAAAAKAGRTGITINSLEPAETNTAAGYAAAGKNVQAWWKNEVIPAMEAQGVKVKVNMDIVECNTAGLFNFNTTKDFVNNQTMKADLKKAGVNIIDVAPTTELSLRDANQAVHVVAVSNAAKLDVQTARNAQMDAGRQ